MTVVSVIVAARNAAGTIGPLLDALAGQTQPRDSWELVVADDASSDETAAVVERSGLGRVVRMDRQGGSYAARNLALAGAASPVLAITDADCRPDPGWLEAGLAEMQARGADLLAGAIEIEMSENPSLAETIDVAAGLDQERYVRRLGFAATANLFVTRAAIEQIGPFNEKLVSGGDVEFSRRATAAGLTLDFSPRPRVRHEARTRGRELMRQSFRHGFGLGQWAQLAGHAPRPGDEVRLWRSWRAWRPRSRVVGAERLPQQPGAARAVALGVAQYAFVQVPRNLGNLSAALRSGRGH